MDYKKFIEAVRKTMKLGMDNDSPLYLIEARGMIKGVMVLFDSSVFTSTEKMEMLTLLNECSHLLLIYAKENM